MFGNVKVVISLILFALISFHLTHLKGEWSGIDFYQYWTVAQFRAANITSNFYSPSQRHELGQKFAEKAEASSSIELQNIARKRRFLDITSTPFLFTVLAVFESGNYETDLIRFREVSILILASSLLGLCALVGFQWRDSLVFVSLIFALFQPLHFEILIGNVGFIQMALFTLFLWITSEAKIKIRYLLAGVILGLLMAFKPSLLFVALIATVWWFLERQWKTLFQLFGGALAGGGVAFLISVLYFGSRTPWIGWITEVLPNEIMRPRFTSTDGNYSLAQVIFDIFGLHTFWFLHLVFFGSLLWIWSHKKVRDTHLLKALLILGVGLTALLPMLVWYQYLIFLLPLIIFLARDYLKSWRFVALIFATSLLNLPPHQWIPLNVYSTLVGVLILFFMGLWNLAEK